ncbi:MAG: glycosyltransferase family 2 protein, partial [Candidatus Nanohaloarchaea archaeon]
GNQFLAKLVELLFQGPRLNDVGCSYRVFHREALESILKEDVSGADTYSPQILIDTLVKDMNVIQIPVNYRERKGESKLTNSLASSLMIGFVMLKYILVRRITV